MTWESNARATKAYGGNADAEPDELTQIALRHGAREKATVYGPKEMLATEREGIVALRPMDLPL